MSQLKSLPPQEVAHICARLRECESSLEHGELAELLSDIDWTVHKTEPDGSSHWLTSRRNPGLKGYVEASDSTDEITHMILGVSQPADELDRPGQLELDRYAEILTESLPLFLGNPDYGHGAWQGWTGATYELEVGRDISQVSVTLWHREFIDRSNLKQQPRPYGDIKNLDDAMWSAFGIGLGRLLGALADLDSVMLMIDESLSLEMNRNGRDIWILAVSPPESHEFESLSHAHRATLTGLGFHPPLKGEARHAAQRDDWWFQLRLPAEPQALESAGHTIADAARRVFDVEQPMHIHWYGSALSTEARLVIDSLNMVEHADTE
ncbi:TY-Chap domain-containing protein [Streptomyces sp. NPDC018031]|uniref:TY-Chap domain-containing protein n=1 Tax=Streptomyces sp. NPDC018031 TaxID=3365033 RepID=UPI00379F6F9C